MRAWSAGHAGRRAFSAAIKADASAHHPAPLGDPSVALESELLEQVLRAGVEVGAALGFPTLDLLGVCLDEPAASFLDRSQGTGHRRPRDPRAAVALSREYAADPPVRQLGESGVAGLWVLMAGSSAGGPYWHQPAQSPPS